MIDIPSYVLGRIKGSGGAGVSYVVVEELPTTGEEGKIYLVPKEDSQTDNVYNEYMYIEDEWELIGDTQADLSNYQTLLSTTNKLNADYIDDSESTNKLTNATEKATWNGKQDVIQYSAMPTASATNVGKIVQFTGTTDSTYTNGYFYQCVSDGEATPTYSWENIEVQAGGGSSSPKYIEDEDGNRFYFAIRYNNTNLDKENLGIVLENMYRDYNNNIKVALILEDENRQYSGIWNVLAVSGDSMRLYLGQNIIVKTSTSSDKKTISIGAQNMYVNFQSGKISSINISATSNPYDIMSQNYIDKTHYENMTGYDATKTQVLKNIQGVLQWVDEA